MNPFLRNATLCFSAGCAGGLANSLAVWLFGLMGITAALGVSISPSLTPGWLYPRIVWGGIWGFIFLVPILMSRPWIRGLIWSLGPSLVQLFVVFPLVAQKGAMGLEIGTLTPVFVLIFNAVWGLAAVALLARVEAEAE